MIRWDKKEKLYIECTGKVKGFELYMLIAFKIYFKIFLLNKDESNMVFNLIVYTSLNCINISFLLDIILILYIEFCKLNHICEWLLEN